MSYILRPFFIMSALLLIGAGCTNANNAISPTSTTDVVIKAPASVITRATADSLAAQRSQVACTDAGYTVVTRFNTASATSETYCQFLDGTECEINAYGSGRCTDQTGVLQPQTADDTAVIASIECTDTSPLVCGTNGHTYQNKCLAAETHIPIAHEGTCTSAEVAKAAPPGAPTEREVPKSQTIKDRVQSVLSRDDEEEDIIEVPPAAVNDKAVATQSSHPAWVDTTISLIEATEPTTPPMYIERCVRGDLTYYLEANGTGDVVSTAYTEDGHTICYPNRDFSNSCPDEVIFRGSCSRVYTDNR